MVVEGDQVFASVHLLVIPSLVAGLNPSLTGTALFPRG